MEPITSLQNARVKLAYSLQQRARTRRKERRIVLEGARLIHDAYEQGHKADFILYEAETADPALLERLQTARAELLPVSAEVMQHLSDTQRPQGLLGVFPLPTPPMPRKPDRVLVLDAVREPGNMGTLLRTAAAAAVQIVILAPGCVDPYNPKVLRAGMGAHLRLPVVEAPWADITAYCEGVELRLAAGDGEALYTSLDWTGRWGLIISSEAHGAGEEALAAAAAVVRIPLAAATESLNAAMAAAIILFEAQRQRGFGG